VLGLVLYHLYTTRVVITLTLSNP